MRILVISHTTHYKNTEGQIVGWGPTVKELNALADKYGEVIHIACLHKNANAPVSTERYTSKVRFVPIKPFGGNGILKKLAIIFSILPVLAVIRKELKYADVFQFRAPTSIGLFIIPYLSLFSKKRGWYKYAGNWIQKKAPLSYRLQKMMLLKQHRKVTINGRWDNQKPQCISMENPCLNDRDRTDGLIVTKSKMSYRPYRLCFVGEVNESKGMFRILEALKNYSERSIFSHLDIVGNGEALDEVSQIAKSFPVPIKIHGALDREAVFTIYKQADFILLPSQSEGFPKVIAEAANFGCIPIVSDVSAIGQYINDSNGFLWQPDKESFTTFFSKIDFVTTEVLKQKSLEAHYMAGAFTYDNYLSKLDKYIINASA